MARRPRKKNKASAAHAGGPQPKRKAPSNKGSADGPAGTGGVRTRSQGTAAAPASASAAIVVTHPDDAELQMVNALLDEYIHEVEDAQAMDEANRTGPSIAEHKHDDSASNSMTLRPVQTVTAVQTVHGPIATVQVEPLPSRWFPNHVNPTIDLLRRGKCLHPTNACWKCGLAVIMVDERSKYASVKGTGCDHQHVAHLVGLCPARLTY